MGEMDRLMETTFSTCSGWGERARRLCRRETHLRWKEGEMTTKLVQSVSAFIWTVPVLAVTSLICSWVRSGSMVTTTASAPQSAPLFLCSAALAEVSMVASSTSVETAPSCTVVEVVLLVDEGDIPPIPSRLDPSQHNPNCFETFS